MIEIKNPPRFEQKILSKAALQEKIASGELARPTLPRTHRSHQAQLLNEQYVI